jgi:subtilase family serine protease
MRCNVRPARPARTRRARLLAVALPFGVVLVAGCTGSPGSSRPAATATHGAATQAGAISGCLVPPASCYAPHQVDIAYGIQPLLDQGIDGSGETVTVMTPALAATQGGAAGGQHPNASPPASAGGTSISQDLAAFDREFALPSARIQVVNSLARAGSPYQAAEQAAMDIEIVHAVAPAAAFRVVLLPANALASPATATADMLAGLRLAVSGTDVALIDWSLGEHFFTKAQAAELNSILLGAQAHHVTVVADSGDNGGFSDVTFGGTAVREVSLPAADPLVLAVGGTELTLNAATDAYVSETAWDGTGGFSESNGASGGGFSRLYARPSYQEGVPGIATMRGVPDVAGDAYQTGGIATVTAIGSQTNINGNSTTGAAASLWAGLIALADQYARHDLGLVNPAIYRIARGASYHQAFHDITTGNTVQTMPYPGGTAGYDAGPGWDPATGWGSPDARVLIPLLAT